MEDPSALAAGCPWFCDRATDHRLGRQESHSSDAEIVPAVRQYRPIMDGEPELNVYLSQEENEAALLVIDGAQTSFLTDDQARALIVAVADQLARRDLTNRQPNPHHCPPWCMFDEEWHGGAELVHLDGGAVHQSRRLNGSGKVDVEAASFTNAEGFTVEHSPPGVFVDATEMTSAQARALAFDVLHAAALADIADALAARP